MTRAGIRDRHAMWAMRKNPADLTGEQRTSLAAIADTNAALYRSYLLKSNYARCSGPRSNRPAVTGRVAVVGVALAHPEFVTLARTIRRYRNLIWNTLDHGLSNAKSRSHQHPPAGIDQRAYRFHSPDALIAMAMLTRGGLCPALPGRK